MYALDQARMDCEPKHLVVMVLIENTRHQGQPATPHTIAPQIAGAPLRDVAEMLEDMLLRLKVLTRVPTGYMVSMLGAEVLRYEVEAWEPSPEEQRKRDMYSASAQVGRMHS
jgi:hypothetical protein